MLNNYLFPSLIRMTWLHHLVYISVMLQSSNGIFHLQAYTLRLIAQMYVKGWSLVIPIALTFQHEYCITIVYTVENMELLHGLVHDKSPNIVKNCEQDITPSSVYCVCGKTPNFINACTAIEKQLLPIVLILFEQLSFSGSSEHGNKQQNNSLSEVSLYILVYCGTKSSSQGKIITIVKLTSFGSRVRLES